MKVFGGSLKDIEIVGPNEYRIMTPSKDQLRQKLGNAEADLKHLQAELEDIETRQHDGYADATRALRIRDEIEALTVDVFHMRVHLESDPN